MVEMPWNLATPEGGTGGKPRSERQNSPARDENSGPRQQGSIEDRAIYKSWSTMEEVLERENIQEAMKRVRSNKGKPGIDGMTVDDLPEFLQSKAWQRIREELLTGEYRPQAVKHVEIPKPQGGVRKLGIPTVTDRLIQQAFLQQIQPAIDRGFSESSYGFRPGRQAHTAIRRMKDLANAGYEWAANCDLEKFFDNVNHDLLMARVARRIEDKRILRTIRRFLQAGMMRGRVRQPTIKGTPQGGPLSPLLSNILLDDLDRELERRGHEFLRYADDFIILTKSRKAAERVLASVTSYLTRKLKLKVNESKSGVDGIADVTYLGYQVIPRKNPDRWEIRISKRTIRLMKQKIRKEAGKRGRGRSLRETVKTLKSYLGGWFGYYQLADQIWDYETLDRRIRRRLRAMIWRQWKQAKTRRRRLIGLGLRPEQASKTAGSKCGPWRASAIPGVHQALPNKYFHDYLGIPSLVQLYEARLCQQGTGWNHG